MRFFTFRSIAQIAILTISFQLGRAAVSPGLSIVSGNGQVVWEQFRTTAPMLFQARDAAGNPAPNLPVTWAITQGQGTLIASAVQTDGHGLAGTDFVATGVTPGYSFTQQTITATTSLGSVSFVITSVVSRQNGGSSPMPLVQVLAPPQNSKLTGRQGSTIAGAFQVQVVALGGPQVGFPIPNVGVRLVDWLNVTGPSPAACTAPVLTDSRGIASCDAVLNGAPGQYFLSASVGDFNISSAAQLTITAGTACSFTLAPPFFNAGSGGGAGAVTLASAQNCVWTTANGPNWITIASGASGAGGGSVTFNVAPNAGIARSGVITIAGLPFTVNQAAYGTAGPLAFTTGTTLPTAVVAAPYSSTMTATGGQLPYTFTATTALPQGLSLNSSSGVLSGTPAAAGAYSFTITVADSLGGSQALTFGLNVVAGGTGSSPAITNSSFPNATPGVAYSQQLSSVGGCGGLFSAPPVFTVAAGALPPGLAITQLAIAGTPTTLGTYAFTLQVTDSCGRIGTRNFSIVVGTGGGGGGNATLAAYPTLLQFTAGSGLDMPSPQVVQISSPAGAVQFNVQSQITDAPGFNWLNVTASSSLTPANLNVSVAPGALPPGNYRGTILVVASGGGSQLVIPVSLRVLPPPVFSVVPNTLYYLYQQGTPPQGAQLLTVDGGGRVFDFTASTSTDSGGSWLFVTPTTTSTPVPLTVSINPIGLPAGTYKGTITLRAVSAGAPPVTIPVTLSILQNGPTVAKVENAASFLEGPIAPGELVTLMGTQLGPFLGQSTHVTAGIVDSVLAETRVLFDGVPGPMIYASNNQVSTIVPYSVNGRASVQVVAEYKGIQSTPAAVRVTDSVPGIFSSPGGQAAALNQDGSPNSTQAGADPGSVIAFYATGEGLTNPTVADGTIMGDVLAEPVLGVSVLANGQPAEVLYKGSAPGFPSGVMQVNVRLPGNLPHGTAVQLSLTVGSATSPTGVTVYVK